MRTALIIAALVGAALLAGTGRARAQELSGYTTFGATRDLNGHRIVGAGGGVLVNLAGSWVAAGVQGDLFVAYPYLGGRGGPLVQVAVVNTARARVFGLGGLSWGEEGGRMFGGGFEIWSRKGIGLRATVEDHVVTLVGAGGSSPRIRPGAPPPPATSLGHQPSVHLGLAWR